MRVHKTRRVVSAGMRSRSTAPRRWWCTVASGCEQPHGLISQRARDALAAMRARGERLGAAPALPLEVTRRIIAERANGRTFQAIADGLMADGISTARSKSQ